MLKKALLIAITILIIAITVVYFILDQQSKKENPWAAIPVNTALVIEIDRPGKLFTKLENKNEVWESLLLSETVNYFRDELSYLDSLQTDASNEFFDKSPLCLSFHFNTESETSEALYIFSLDKTRKLDGIRKLFKSRFILKENTGDKNIFTVSDTVSGKVFYLSNQNNLLIASANQSLVRQSLSSLSSKNQSFLNNENLQKLKTTTGSRVDARIYINYNYFGNVLGNFAHPNYKEQLNWLTNFAGWTEVDLIVKNEEILLSGFSVADTGKNYFLNAFANQKPVEHGVFNILPYNTNLLLCLGFSDFSGYPFPNDLKKINSQINFDLSKLIQLIDGEIALANNATNTKNIKAKSWFLLRVSNPSKVQLYLDQISKNTNGKSTTNSTGYKIRQINSKGLIPNIFGNAFSVIQDNWYTLIGNYVVFANSKRSIENFIRINETGKTLDLNENFKIFSDNISKTSNILLFLKPRDFTGKPEKYLNGESLKFLQKNESTLKNFEGLIFQFRNEGELFFTNFYLKNNKNYQDENLALWKVQLDDAITGKPFPVKDHNTGNLNVVVFDQSANIYLVSSDGRILWKKRVDALPESPIYEVDYYKNGKIQYLFNSPDFIYLIDKNGDYVSGYPKKLNPSATNGLSLLDYKNNRNYRLVVAQSDKRIYNYTLAGKQVKGWSRPRTQNIVLDQVERLVVNKKDYFMITDSENEISIVNRKGNQRIKLKENPHKAKNSTFYVNKTNSKGIILSTNSSGKLFYISASGKLQYTDFGDFSVSHFFLYEDFNGNGARDFIYVDGDKLQVFDRFKNVLFSYRFDSPISIKPEFFLLGKKKKVMGIIADQEKTIYLFDDKGNTIISKGLVGETPFTVGSLENNSELNLVTGTGNTLYNYRID